MSWAFHQPVLLVGDSTQPESGRLLTKEQVEQNLEQVFIFRVRNGKRAVC